VNTSTLVVAIQALSALGAVATVASFYWSNVRVPAKRLGIIDLATKQIAFWDQALKLELSATTDTAEQEKVKHRAYAAVQRIRSHADRELARLCWSQKTNNLLYESQSNRLVFKMRRPPRFLKTSEKFEWYLSKVTCWVFIALAVVILLLLVINVKTAAPLAAHNRLYQTVMFAFFLTNLLIAGHFGAKAEKLAFPSKPSAPILDEM
jgi:hypothetical protein